MKFKILMLGLFLASSLLCSGQWTIFNTSNSGLAFNKIKAMAIGKDGKIWMGYDNSGNVNHLCVYDGVNWTNSLTSAWVNDIDCDEKGNIWLTTSDFQLRKFNGTEWRNYSCMLVNSPWTEPVFADQNSNVWVGKITDKAMLKFDGANWVIFDDFNSCLHNPNINSIAQTSKGIWFGTSDSGLILFSPTDSIYYKTNNSNIPSNSVYAVKKGLGDTLWMVCSGGYLVAYSDGFHIAAQHPNLNSAKEIEIDSKGNIWVLNPDFTNGGLFMYDHSKWTVFNKTNSGLPTNQNLSLEIDNLDQIWIGTWGEGLVKYQYYHTSINQPKDIAQIITAFPNPVNSILTLKFDEVFLNLNNGFVEIYQSNGEKMFSAIISENEQKIDVSSFPSGIYLIRVFNCTINSNSVFIKE